MTKADHDLEIVRRELNLSEELLTDVLCYHCQQAVEKYLKTFLISKMVKPPKTHDIITLVEECGKIDSDFESLSDYAYMTAYASELRYADDFYLPSRAETEKAYADTVMVKKFVGDKIKI